MRASAISRTGVARRSRKIPEPARTLARNALRLRGRGSDDPVFRCAVARSAGALPRRGREQLREVLARLFKENPNSMRAWVPVAKIFPTDADLGQELAIARADGTRFTWAPFEAIVPLAELPADERLQQARVLLARARAEDLSAREIRKAAKEIRDRWRTLQGRTLGRSSDADPRSGVPTGVSADAPAPRTSGASEDEQDQERPNGRKESPE